MFVDTMEPRTQNKNSSLEKTVLIMWAQIRGNIASIVHKFFALRNLRRDLHMFLGNVKLRIENNN